VLRYYSRGLNYWGVKVQRNNQLKPAGEFFARAFQLNSNNVPAYVNEHFNQGVQAGRAAPPPDSADLEQRFGQLNSVDSLLSENGPFDEPQFCEWLGNIFLSQSLHRQAIQQYSRTVHFQPTNFVARIGIAKGYIYGNWIDRGMEEVASIQKDFPKLPETNRIALVSLEAAGYYARNDFPRAEKTLKDAAAAEPDQPAFEQSLFELYRATRHWTNALEVLDSELHQNPTNSAVLLRKAETYMGMEDLKTADKVLDEVLAVAPRQTSALLYKAFIALQQKRYDAALAAANRILQYDLDNPQALVYRGIVYLETKEYDKAFPPLNRVLKDHPDQVAALRNRALLNLRSDHLKGARQDYEQLRKIMPYSYAVYYGLGEVAYKQKDFEEAEKQYKKYLKYAPKESNAELDEEKQQVQTRLREIQTALK
jgi:tetratricopeptide (TPR) repeat protein